MIEWTVLPVGVGVGVASVATALDAYGPRVPIAGRRYDAVIVAGCRVFPDGTPSRALTRRVQLASRLHLDGVAPRVVLTGGVSTGAPHSEAYGAALLCAAYGVPESALILEEHSRSTLENARFAAALVPAPEWDVLVVSDVAHLFRCRRMFARHFRSVDVVGSVPTGRARAEMALREAFAVVRHALDGHL